MFFFSKCVPTRKKLLCPFRRKRWKTFRYWWKLFVRTLHNANFFLTHTKRTRSNFIIGGKFCCFSKVIFANFIAKIVEKSRTLHPLLPCLLIVYCDLSFAALRFSLDTSLTTLFYSIFAFYCMPSSAFNADLHKSSFSNFFRHKSLQKNWY